MRKKCQERLVRIREVSQDQAGRKIFKVTIIREGLGNLRDRNYYSEAAIKSGPKVYEGKKAYFDHPTPDQEKDQPNRSVREAVGHYENVKAELASDGLWELNADLVPVPTSSCIPLLEHAVLYKKKYPDKDFVGISINGDGEGVAMEWDVFLKEVKPKPPALEKLKELEGQTINNITRLTDAVSADLVTEPGAGGKVIGLKESNKFKEKKKMANLSGLMKRLFTGVEKKDEKLIEAAVEDVKKLLQHESEDDDKKSKEDKEKSHEAEADSMVKHMLNFKKENEKKESESEQEYEARAMKQAFTNMKKEMEDEASKDKKEGKDDKEDKDGKEDKSKKTDDGDGDDDDKEKDSKESEAEDDDGDDDDKSDDKSKDKSPIKKMMKQIGEMEAKIQKMEDMMSKKEDEASKAKEEAVILKTEKAIRAREELIDSLLSKSGEPREITKIWREILTVCKNEKAIKDTIQKLQESASQERERYFEMNSGRGLIERDSNEDLGSNDELFLK